MVKIALDAGHGIYTAGKRTPDGEREWSFNNKVLLACQYKLMTFKNVEILRLDDPKGEVDVPLTTRTALANRWGADALVSIHHNANAGVWGDHGGVETYIQPTASEASKNIANLIHPRIVKAMGLRDRKVRTKDLHMTRESRMPAVLTEGGFMDSTTDIYALRDGIKLQAQGEAIADAIAVYFKLEPKEVSTVTKPEYSSPALQAETELTLGSRARRKIIVDSAVEAGAHMSWKDKLENGTITNADILGLAAKYLVDTHLNKE